MMIGHGLQARTGTLSVGRRNCESERDGVERFAQRLIADRVNHQLKAFVLRVQAFALQFIGPMNANPARVWIVGVRLCQQRCSRAE